MPKMPFKPMEERMIEHEPLRYFSMFSGIGGFELGIQRAMEKNKDIQRGEFKNSHTSGRMSMLGSRNKQRWGNEQQTCCIGFSEIDKYSIQTYKKHFREHKNYGDAKTINAERLPDFDLLVGGFPCQSFSIAGKRRGFEDVRGTLFYEIARILKAKRPQYFVLENVKGLLNHDKGQTFRVILQTLGELNYQFECGVVNSKYYGVPQNRERVFLIGSIRGQPRTKVFPLRTSNGETKELVYHQKSDREIARIYKPEGIAPTIHLKTEGWQEPKIVANCLDANYYKGNSPSHIKSGRTRTMPFGIRRLTPLECERLQGFPDSWTKEGINEQGKTVLISDTQRYKQLGNAVTVNVVETIMRKLKND